LQRERLGAEVAPGLAADEKPVACEEMQPSRDQSGVGVLHAAMRDDLFSRPGLASDLEGAEGLQRLDHGIGAVPLERIDAAQKRAQLRRDPTQGATRAGGDKLAFRPSCRAQAGRAVAGDLRRHHIGDERIARVRRNDDGVGDQRMTAQGRLDLPVLVRPLRPAVLALGRRQIHQGRQRRSTSAHRPPAGRLFRRHHARIRLAPRAVVLGEPPQTIGVGREHVVQQAGREQLLDRIPGQMQVAGALVDLVIEIDLRRLRHPIDHLADAISRLPSGHALRERAGEDYGHRARPLGIAAPRDLLQQLKAAILAMIEVVAKLRGDAPGQRLERVGRIVTDFQQQERGEIADQAIDVRMQRSALKQRGIEGEMRRLAARAEDARKGRHQHARLRQAGLRGAGLELAPLLLLEHRLAANELWVGDGGRSLHQRQLGSGRKRIDATQPIFFRPPVAIAVALPERPHDVVAKTDLERRQIRILLERQLRPLVQQELHAPQVDEQQVETEMQQHLPVELGRAQLEQRPPIGREHLVRHEIANTPQLRLCLGRVDPAQVQVLDDVVRRMRKDLLHPIGTNHRPQHVVAIGQALPTGLHAAAVDIGHIQFEVDVAGDVA
jgi:hypothetical protein